jgi:cytochrome P450
VPWITARKPWKAREKLVASFIKYYEARGYENSSQFAYGRWKTQHDASATKEDIARLEVAMGIGLLANTVPSTFWTIFDIYSCPTLLDEVREEIRQNAVHLEIGGVHTVDLADIGAKCPLLVSAFQETLRLRSVITPTRVVYKDIMLNDQYLLKAGAVLQMPSFSVNRNEDAWGKKSTEFDGRRFLKNPGQKDSRRPSGFLSFGVSPNICPGRHFASGEILALAAMLILRFDITPITDRWVPPRGNPQAIAASLSSPQEECKVIVTAREEYQGVQWAFRVTEGKGRFGLIIG